MINQELVRIFSEMADILELKNVDWKPQAYRHAARSIDALKQDLVVIYETSGLKGLDDIPSIGEGISKKIEEYIKTGKISAYEELKTAAITHKIKHIVGFGEKSEKEILEGLDVLKGSKDRILLKDAEKIGAEIVSYLKKSKDVKQVSLAGSLRRKKETVGDIDVLVSSNSPEKVTDFFEKFKGIKKVLVKGDTKVSVILKSGIQTDLRVVKPESWGAALLYFTGSKNYDIELRKIAKKKGFKLNEYGLFDAKTGEFIVVK